MENVTEIHPMGGGSTFGKSNKLLQPTTKLTKGGGPASISMAMVATANVVLASGSSSSHHQKSSIKGAISSSVDARHSVIRQRKPVSINRED